MPITQMAEGSAVALIREWYGGGKIDAAFPCTAPVDWTPTNMGAAAGALFTS